jgi:Zn-dependent peptidase ImmA (M78 family)
VLVNYDEDVYRQRFTAAHEGGHAILDADQPFVVSFDKWDAGDLAEIGANVFAGHYLVPDDTLGTLGGVTWTPSVALDTAQRFSVNIDTLVFRLVDQGYVDQALSAELRRHKVPRAAKVDPELPSSLPAASRLRKEELLQRGLSTYYVSLCFDAHDQGAVTRARLAEMLLTHESELADLRALFHGGARARG